MSNIYVPKVIKPNAVPNWNFHLDAAKHTNCEMNKQLVALFVFQTHDVQINILIVAYISIISQTNIVTDLQKSGDSV